ncbi:MAG: hypothetical protein AAF447_16860 [Myxococcota bacterium]
MKRTLATLVLLVSALACGDDGSSTTGTAMDMMTGGGGLVVPAIASMGDRDGTAGGIAHAGLCQRSFDNFDLVDGGNTGACGFSPPGFPVIPYVFFQVDGDAYTVEAGDILESDGETRTPVEFMMASAGTVEDGAPDRVTGIPVETSVTITTQDRELTFSFTGSSVTVTGFASR